MERPKFTKDQIDWVCYQIGEWYLDWKHGITDHGVQHKLGFAKEKLKERLFPYRPGDSFRCPKCEKVSYNEDDVLNQYCANCDEFMPDYTGLIVWWGYHHIDGTVHVKRFFNHVDLMQSMASDFVQGVFTPFVAKDRATALLKCNPDKVDYKLR